MTEGSVTPEERDTVAHIERSSVDRPPVLPRVRITFTPTLEALINVVGEPEGWTDERGNVTPGEFSERQAERIEEDAFQLLNDDYSAEVDF